MNSLSVEKLFGQSGTIYPNIIKPILHEVIGTQYTFMDIEKCEKLPIKLNKVYWEEILYRAHWAATSNLIRYTRWFDACVTHSVEQPNFPAFCASLRSLVESSADTAHSLHPVPEMLATNSAMIIEALKENLDNTIFVSEDLENILIHFLFARRLNKDEKAPTTHQAKRTAQYIKEIDHNNYPIKELYSELCQVVHPAAQSLHWLTKVNSSGCVWAVCEPDDSTEILNLCTRHLESIVWIQQHSVNSSIFIFKVLNVFPISALHSKSTLNINMSNVNAFNKLKLAFAQNQIKWC